MVVYAIENPKSYFNQNMRDKIKNVRMQNFSQIRCIFLVLIEKITLKIKNSIFHLNYARYERKLGYKIVPWKDFTVNELKFYVIGGSSYQKVL